MSDTAFPTPAPAPGGTAARPLQFLRRGEVVSLANVPPTRTLLEVLREDLTCTGTKEGCGEGDCGACTVVLGEPDAASGGQSMRFRAINSCIRLAHSIDGMALWTVEDIAEAPPTTRPASGAAPATAALHPAQEAMVQCHGSQCGFCTPGFVMSLFGMYQNRVCKGEAITREIAQQDLSGNLCRCTGYRPILEAATSMADFPATRIDETALLGKLATLAADASKLTTAGASYLAPTTLPALLQARAAHPAAQVVAGCTDVGLWVTKLHMQFGQVLDVTRAEELRRIEHEDDHIVIGAAVTLDDAYAALVADRPQLQNFAARFAGLPVRNSGTLGGNVANGSPIGDSMPLLIALGASIVLMSMRAGQQVSREMPLEKLYTGYRQNVMAPDELLAWIKVPKAGIPHPNPLPKGEGADSGTGGLNPTSPGAQAGRHHPPSTESGRAGTPLSGAEGMNMGTGHASEPPRMAPSPLWGEGGGEGLPEFLRVYKISKRYDDDISAVCLAIKLHIVEGVVMKASIGAGGVAATPVRAVQTEAALTGQPWTQETVTQAMTALRAEFSPISDMRASATYRRQVLGNLLQRYWLESQGMQQINLATFRPDQIEEVA
ncbi:MAG: FAD binding domain-containing protein [Polaromonas sp.]|nr:FAD binding domain-containing protein [Polaromonas sp.]